MKQYSAIFFDWDGTAVISRNAPVDEVAAAMKKLLARGVKLAIISGTTFENIAGGCIQKYFTEQELENLYLGLGRGAYNYRFDRSLGPVVFHNQIPSTQTLLDIHRASFEVHEELLKQYGFPTDIVFSRPNYCKIDLLVDLNRGDQLFFQENELKYLKDSLKQHHFDGGLQGLLSLAAEKGRSYGLKLSATTDAKYLEVGVSSKSDNAAVIMGYLKEHYGIQANECCFWGDEYVGMEDGIFGSDSFMITEQTAEGDFFDVSEATGIRPDNVSAVGGGVSAFLSFLEAQASL